MVQRNNALDSDRKARATWLVVALLAGCGGDQQRAKEPDSCKPPVLTAWEAPDKVKEETFADAVMLSNDAASDYEGFLYLKAARGFMAAAKKFREHKQDGEYAENRLKAYRDAVSAYAMANNLAEARTELERAKAEDKVLSAEIDGLLQNLPEPCAQSGM
jgi:hypothetical protein